MRRPAGSAPALVVALTLAVTTTSACTATVDGAGRPAVSVVPTTATPGPGSTSSGAPAGSALEVWNGVRETVLELPAVTVTGTFAGAAFGPSATGAASIEATFGTRDDQPLATAVVRTAGQTIEIRATGETAWAKATTAFLTSYGYSPAEAAQANGRWAVLTDDDSGLDVFASLAAFLQICAPDDTTDDLTATPTTAAGADATELASEFDGGSVTVTTDPGRILTSRYTGDDLTFGYPTAAPAVAPPAAAQIVTIPDF